jgi:hypothetical protein
MADERADASSAPGRVRENRRSESTAESAAMPAKRILFVPWSIASMNFSSGIKESAGAEYFEKNSRWQQAVKEREDRKFLVDSSSSIDSSTIKQVIQVFYTETGHGSVLRTLGPGDAVYVRGHCLPGLDCIFSRDDFLRVHQTQDPVVRDAMRSGDSTTKCGADSIKADEVVRRLQRMGLPFDFAGDVKCYNCHSLEGNPSFAQRFADAMYAAGYERCTVHGYRGALDSYHQTDGHKASTHDGKRASQNRQVVTPSQRG